MYVDEVSSPSRGAGGIGGKVCRGRDPAVLIPRKASLGLLGRDQEPLQNCRQKLGVGLSGTWTHLS